MLLPTEGGASGAWPPLSAGLLVCGLCPGTAAALEGPAELFCGSSGPGSAGAAAGLQL